MFKRYTDGAKRVIFFAQYEAQQFGSRRIEPEHLLLGLIRESPSRANLFFGLEKHATSFRVKIEQAYPPSSPLAKDTALPLSNASQRVLSYTATEADKLSSAPIDTDHLVLGLLREEECFAATLLSEIGLDFAKARKIVAPGAGPTSGPERKAISPFMGIILVVILLLAIYLVIKLALGK